MQVVGRKTRSKAFPVMQMFGTKTRLAVLLAIVAAVRGKMTHRKARLATLVKRFLGFLLTRVLPIPKPTVVSGKGSIQQIASVLKGLECKRPLIVTDKVLVDHGLVKPVTLSLDAQGLTHETYDAVVPNPHAELVEEGHEVYKRAGCDSIIAFGGGSPMDVAKAVGAKVANPKPVEAYQGYLKVNRLMLRPLPPLIAIPTTAGTGSETTVVSVITIKDKNSKIAICDLGLVPRVAVLDPEVLEKLPQGITAATGMDALTHALESYLSSWSSAFTRRNSLSAVDKIFKNIVTCYKDGSNLEAREAMLNASHEAGLAFTRANVGYVHAIAHQFGGMFHTPHGEANAMLLPHVLDFYLQDERERGAACLCATQYCELARVAGLAPDYDAAATSAAGKLEIARKFVAGVAELNRQLAIPTEVKGMRADNVDEVAARALREAHGEVFDAFTRPVANVMDLGYPVPKYMTHDDCKAIIAKVLPADEKRTADEKRAADEKRTADEVSRSCSEQPRDVPEAQSVDIGRGDRPEA